MIPTPVRISVVIPVFNEAETLRKLLAKVEAVEIDKEVIIVDDGTRDLLTKMSRPDRVWCEKAAEARSVLVESPK